MTRLPRDVSGEYLAGSLTRLGYAVTRQRGSHMRLTTTVGGQHHLSVPRQDSLHTGLLAALLADVAAHFGISRDELLDRLFS